MLFTPRMRICAVIVVTAIALGCLPGCNVAPGGPAETKKLLVAHQQGIEAELLKPGLSAEAKAELEALKDETLDAIADLDASQGPNALEDTIGAVSTAVPGWGTAIAGAAGVAFGVWRKLAEDKARKRADNIGKVFTQTVAGINAAKEADPALDAALKANKDKMHAKMDTDAIALVSETIAKA